MIMQPPMNSRVQPDESRTSYATSTTSRRNRGSRGTTQPAWRQGRQPRDDVVTSWACPCRRLRHHDRGVPVISGWLVAGAVWTTSCSDAMDSLGVRVGRTLRRRGQIPCWFRSAAVRPVSMPGMMDTVLNLGLTVDRCPDLRPSTARRLSRTTACAGFGRAGRRNRRSRRQRIRGRSCARR